MALQLVQLLSSAGRVGICSTEHFAMLAAVAGQYRIAREHRKVGNAGKRSGSPPEGQNQLIWLFAKPAAIAGRYRAAR